jgi:hypothetical protein
MGKKIKDRRRLKKINEVYREALYKAVNAVFDDLGIMSGKPPGKVGNNDGVNQEI